MNNNRFPISVVMTTYNGEKYIKKQIDSIIKQLESNDELIVSDDGSSDSTIDIINSYNDPRIVLLKGPKDGINKNFENGLKNVHNDYIFLCDQDDIWEDYKIKKCLEYFNSDSELVLIRHNASIIDENDNIINDDLFTLKNITQKNSKILKSLISNKYQGCTMVFNKKILNKIIPIPKKFYLFDLWIGIIASLNGKVLYVNDKLIKYRRYSSNNSAFYKRDKFAKIISRRIINFSCFIKYLIVNGNR